MQNDTISARIKGMPKTPYQRCAAKFGTSYVYVVQIATGARIPVRGKGLEIKKWLEEFVHTINS
jgi:hypothetical protein